ncbi:aldo/keto reductase [Legionella maioricensis]|uniref:Aldo/keto reductase n=1 Tax=Legionella maioricensis TaxID=2896528 RepID=A0A9X2D0F8_9GAMM|nr:aldo/keto reductase [Legionella maioricensis]MCL9683577.1 aldo/keto reductase [Legionella maioricensis]MCL9686876.1 aldo/keto reductase [Legionella maioricensis]
MRAPNVELALGTVQFGMKYGIVGRGEPVPTKEVQNIFARAWEYGIRVLDTAPAYGTIEENLGPLTEGYPFRMVSKIPALPKESSSAEIAHFVTHSIQKSRERLGERLTTLLFHRSEDLLEQHGTIAWQAAFQAISDSSIRLGVSCYSPSELALLQNKFPIAVAQIPGNALDQRITATKNINNVELYLRSVFLQGILLLAPEIASKQLPQATNSINAWGKWCDEHQLTPLQASLSIAKGLPGVRYCVVGVDKLSHLEEILTAWTSAVPLTAPSLSTDDTEVIDPRRW